MPRLPKPGKDQNIWGNILNDFLSQAHNNDGSLKSSAISSAIGGTPETTTGAQAKVDARIADPAGQDDNQLLLTSGGAFTLSKDLTMSLPTFEADGTVHDGVIRRAQSIIIPWNYTMNRTPTDVAKGTAVHVPIDVTMQNGGFNPPFGPTFSTGHFGPRGIINVEGLIKYEMSNTGINPTPIGYADTLAVVNRPIGTPRTINRNWTYMDARQVVAQGATVTVSSTDTNSGGAAFVSTPVFVSTDGGHIDGMTHNVMIAGTYIGGLLAGSVEMKGMIGLEVSGFFTQDLTGTEYPYTGQDVGQIDAPNVIIHEQIGVRINEFSIGNSKIGMQSAHPIEVTHTDISHDSVADGAMNMLSVPNRTMTLTTTPQFSTLTDGGTYVFSADGGAFGSGGFATWNPTIKNDGTARSLGGFVGQTGLISAPIYTGDGAALTSSGIGHIGVNDVPKFQIANGGTVTFAQISSFRSGPEVTHAGTTINMRKGVDIVDAAGSGTVDTQVGVDITTLAKGSTANIGIRNASTTVNTPGVQNITAATQAITANSTIKQLTANASYTLTSAPTIANGQDGQVLTILNADTTDAITLQDQGTLAGSNLRLSAASIALGPRDSITLVYSSTVGDWIQIAQTNVL